MMMMVIIDTVYTSESEQFGVNMNIGINIYYKRRKFLSESNTFFKCFELYSKNRVWRSLKFDEFKIFKYIRERN